jgi:hypothetical protein
VLDMRSRRLAIQGTSQLRAASTAPVVARPSRQGLSARRIECAADA